MYERSVDAARRGVRAHSDALRRLLHARAVSFFKRGGRKRMKNAVQSSLPGWYSLLPSEGPLLLRRLS